EGTSSLQIYLPIYSGARHSKRVPGVRKRNAALRIGLLLADTLYNQPEQLVRYATAKVFTHHEVRIGLNHYVNKRRLEPFRHKLALESFYSEALGDKSGTFNHCS